MRVDRLVIVCVLCDQSVLDTETKAGGKALYERYSRPTDFGRTHVMAGDTIGLYHVQCKLNANKDAVSQEWGAEDRVVKISGADQGDHADARKLGVYLLVHSSGADLEGFHPKKVAGLLKALRLTNVTKLCLIACKGAFGNEAAVADQGLLPPLMEDKGDPSILYALCDDLAKADMKPKMAGWAGFVSVVPESSPEKPSLKVRQSQSNKKSAEIDYATEMGRKSMHGSQGHPVLVKTFPQLKTDNERKRKVYYAWDNGVRCLAQGDWTDKT